MHKGFIRIAAITGLLSVVLGAFAAHALKESIPGDALNIFETGVRYQFYHVFALLAAGILYKEFPNRFIRWSGILFFSGMLIFCGSLYILTYIKGAGLANFNWIGAITPLGGICFIAGWLFLFLGCYKKK
jgi:uncharacterized membrane protein YgdD (TMEM256/DUF423 family)